MGLDMYLTGRKSFWPSRNTAEDRQEDGFKVERLELELGYWRKHPNLHGYIVREFAGGVDECQEIALDAAQLTQLLAAVKEDKLPFTQGFFFGKSQPEDKPETIAILEKAIAWLEVSDSDPVTLAEPVSFPGGAIAAVSIDPRDRDSQIVVRRVVYRASW